MTINRNFAERLGFNDPELLSPAHDELVLWIGEHAEKWILDQEKYDPLKNLEELQQEHKTLCLNKIRQLGKEAAKWTKPNPSYGEDGYSHREDYRVEQAREYEAKARQYLERAQNGLPLPEIPAASVRTTFEVPVKTGSGYIVGFIDAVAKAELPKLECWGDQYDDESRRLVFTSPKLHYAFEAKPRIPSLGQLLRQLQAYQSCYIAETKFVVVSPDTRFREAITGQGFLFWENSSKHSSNGA